MPYHDDDAGADIDAEFEAFDSSALAALDEIEARHLDAPPDDDIIDDSLAEVLIQDLDDVDAEVSAAAEAAPQRPPVSQSQSQSQSQAQSQSQSQMRQTLLPGASEPQAPVQTATGLMLLAPGARHKAWDNSAYLQGRNLKQPPPIHQEIDMDAARTWIYPVNKPLRTYQLNIVRKALFHNVLVALPTGLGKTFIAAVVILNMFRWFPKGKIIFVAPTRPLVNQQQMACHAICGLPWEHAIELTGSTRRRLHGDEWRTKRIFYMTPQAFENDLLSNACDARDVVCVVVDEAHRATGNYSYCTVIRHLMFHNPKFRVLALTATPGSTADRVQEVVDNLHIDMIELRTEEALDIQPYIHRKREEIVNVELGYEIEEMRSAWAKLMRVYLEPLQKAGILRNADPLTLRNFAVRAATHEPAASAVLNQRGYLRGHIAILASMALAMQYLSEHSVRTFAERARGFGTAKGKTKKADIFSPSNPDYAKLLELLDTAGYDTLEHPKIAILIRILHEHFNEHAVKEVDSEDPRSTRAMVFCSYREVVNELVDAINGSGLTAKAFIGQATDTKGNRGLTQRKQEELVSEFRDGKIQVLVATSIGEEGLDIGEVDLIVCYEAVRDSVRALQRVGRTGRQRDGRIVVLATRREHHNWQHSKESYRNVQKLIRAADTIALYTDVSRILPKHVRPEPVLAEVDQPKFSPPKPRIPRKTKTKPKTPKKTTPAQFCSASDLRREWASQREGGTPRSDTSRSVLQDDSEDEELSTDPVIPTRASASGDLASDVSAVPSSSPSKVVAARKQVTPPSQSTPPLFLSTPTPPRQFERYEPHPMVTALKGTSAGPQGGAHAQIDASHEPEPMRIFADEQNSDEPLAMGVDDEPIIRTGKRHSTNEQRSKAQPHKRKRRRVQAATGLFSVEAERDTSSDEHGESDEDDDGPSTDEADDDDRAAVGDFEATQVSGYNQQAVYMQSMLSQRAPTPFRGPDRLAALLQRRAAARPPSEPPASDDEYSQGSFVVGDDEVEWDETQSSLPL
ncbi:DNA helicase [Malassezia cuniculi]|uniref:ATP-dependent DNA helicase n=1 Tax=Malassezia cuniculi TaxID=948313 RepID=A0AAF0EXT3_9BASI|nr:DNA helicase [Malassezia cuniculi]